MTERTFRAVPVETRSIFIETAVQRVERLECAHVRQVDIPFASPKEKLYEEFRALCA